ncbi:ABC transporter ATP-binding protein [Vagococcus zengguangii]|nr:ABC transporter ATP-binding protein [Vagococcus zengguangii]
MKPMSNTNIAEKNIPGMRRGGAGRFAEVEKAENIWPTLKRIWQYFAKEKMLLLVMLIIVIIGTFFGIYAPTRQSLAIDILSGEQSGNLTHAIWLMLVAYALYSISQLIQGLLSATLSQRIVKRLREQLFGKIMDVPIRYLDSNSHGDVMSRMTNDIENISTTVSQSIVSLFSGVLTIIGTAGIMLWYSWQLALLSFASILLTVFATKILSGFVRKYSRQRQSFLGELNGTVQEMVTGYRTVVAYNHQQATTSEFEATSDKLTKAGIKTDIFSGVMGPLMNAISNLGFVVVAVFGGYFAIKGYLSVGVISAFIVYTKQFTRPVNEIAQVYGQLQTAIAGAERVFMVLDEEDEEVSGGQELNIHDDATVMFEALNFSYDDGQPVIKDFTLEVPSGQKIALVGATGSGKSTIVNLLMRFYEADSGKILINGQDISAYSRASLRQKIAIVLQEAVFFSDTIENNLKYGNPKATREEVERAVEMSRATEMLARLPKGYETMLTSSGANISQGQRQLLSIARAFVTDPKILILDEATSNVDTRTEEAIQTAMQEVMKNRTSIVIAHRLSTIRDADKIIVMDHGKIVESGNHEELLTQKGKYFDLYMTQYAGFEI